MATILVSSAASVFGAGATVSAYPAGQLPAGADGPVPAAVTAIASAAIAADGSLTITNAALVAGRSYPLTAPGRPQTMRVRSTLDVHDRGRSVASAATRTSGSAALTAVTLCSGRAPEVGARVEGVGLKSGSVVLDVQPGAVGTYAVTLSEPATSSGTSPCTFDGSLAVGNRRDARKAIAGAI